jgi:predicted RNA polymerase sigma factor
MGQRISRAKQTIQSSGTPFVAPEGEERTRRLQDVLHVLYLTFNEGYSSSAGRELVRVELASEAIRLTRALRHLVPEDCETAGLLALMLLTDARRGARTAPQGELIPLDEQDRRLWDRARIDEGAALITTTLARGSIGAYQIQAAIAALHDEAPSTAATDWPQILALYGLLEACPTTRWWRSTRRRDRHGAARPRARTAPSSRGTAHRRPLPARGRARAPPRVRATPARRQSYRPREPPAACRNGTT